MSVYSQIEPSDTSQVSILKDNFLIDKTDYEKEMINKQYNKLYFNSLNESNQMKKAKNEKIIYNLSLSQIFQNMSNVIVQVLNEYSILIKDKDRNYNKYVEVLIKEDRMIYVGIIFIILALMIFFIFVSS
tara:strand:- start:76 stop:465 length:390 start_codon:yes stop_codon:yes gene_type:complete